MGVFFEIKKLPGKNPDSLYYWCYIAYTLATKNLFISLIHSVIDIPNNFIPPSQV